MFTTTLPAEARVREAGPPGRFIYQSHNEPNQLFKHVVSDPPETFFTMKKALITPIRDPPSPPPAPRKPPIILDPPRPITVPGRPFRPPFYRSNSKNAPVSKPKLP
ncbi:hypothetical protein VNO77_14782 [Canavalia gladiata]|uniref:Uncharacterized protein n=1 Tax=Canavalia gladiata TaxID=3824 RepID=A0AAN9LYF6_CANGL